MPVSYTHLFFICGLTRDDFTDLTPQQMKRYEELYHDPQLFFLLGKTLCAVSYTHLDVYKRQVVASLEDDPEGGEEQPDILGSLYDETQQWIMKNYPDSYAAQTYIAAAEELVNGTDAQSGENDWRFYIMLLARRNNSVSNWLDSWFNDNFFNTSLMPHMNATAPAVNVKESATAYTMERCV